MTNGHADIPDGARIFRRVHPEQVIWDGNEGRLRPTSAAFRGHEMSVNLGSIIATNGQRGTHAVCNYPRHHLVALTAGFVRNEEGQAVRPGPLPDDDSHGNVVGDKPRPRRTRFALRASWAVLRHQELNAELAGHASSVMPDDRPMET